jgi:tripartite-type tricarboxylate transporter receptor subunit TctC
MKGRRPFLQFVGIVVASVVTLSNQAAWSQTTRTIKLVVPFPSGGPTDTLARVVGPEVSRLYGATIVVENRPGAEGMIGTEAVSRAAHDGNTLLITTGISFVVNAHLRRVKYDPLTSFEPICQFVNSPMVLVVNSASPYRTLADFVGAGRAKPGDLTLAGGGAGTRVLFEMFKRAASVNITYVPYPGAAPAVTALLGGHVDAELADYAPLAEQLNAGKLRALATPSATRIAQLPDVPTIAESGYKDFEAGNWYGLFAPAGTPMDVVSLFAEWFGAALRMPAVTAKLVTLGLYPAVICGMDFGAFIRKQYDEYGRVVREANIKAE